MSIVVRQKREEWMIDLKRVMVWLMFSRSELLTAMKTKALPVAGTGVFVRREVISESSESSALGSTEQSTIFSFADRT